MAERKKYILVVPSEFEWILKSLSRKPDLFNKLSKQIKKILDEPLLGKPLRNVLRNYRRVHIGFFYVLIYEIRKQEVRLMDFDHHDRVYKRYK